MFLASWTRLEQCTVFRLRFHGGHGLSDVQSSLAYHLTKREQRKDQSTAIQWWTPLEYCADNLPLTILCCLLSGDRLSTVQTAYSLTFVVFFT